MCASRQSLSLAKAVTGFKKYKLAEGLTKGSLRTYSRNLKAFLDFIGADTPMSAVGPEDITDYIYYLRVDYRTKSGGRLAPKTINNHFVTLQSFFLWGLQRRIMKTNIFDTLKPPKIDKPEIQPFAQHEIEALLMATKKGKLVKPKAAKPYRVTRATYRRDKALLLFMLDTGARATEVCNIKLKDVDDVTGEIIIRRGKGGKGRTVYIGRGTQKALWDYLLEREDAEDPEAYLFVTSRTGGQMSSRGLWSLFNQLEIRSGVHDCHPHRMRHTAAVQMLRGGMDVFSLKRILGHSTLAMTNRYVNLVKADLANAHRTASPVDKWGL